MLCYRCGSHVPDTAEKCPTCGQNLAGGGLRQATGTFSRRRASTGQFEGAPYKAQDLVASRYLIKDVVGAGPLGFVFRAHDKEIDVEVALKVINPKLVQTADERKAFAKQLRQARKLSHPNLVRVYEEGEDQDRPYFTSQFLDGLTLRKIIDLRLQKGGFFNLAEIDPILAQVCAALDGAHKIGAHSDVKPDNVLVLPDLLKVTDFGLGLAMPRLPFVQAMKARKADRYLAPELIDGTEVDVRADVYSVGVILGEMLSGLTPDGSIPELGRRNPDVPAAVEGIYRKAINQNPNARFKTAAEFIADLGEQVKKLTPNGAPARPKPEPASGLSPAARPRTSTGMLQLQPRRDIKPPPPVGNDGPPPPPPISSEQMLPDMTQPVDAADLADALKQLAPPVSAADVKQDRQETEVIDSGMFIASLDAEDKIDTKANAPTVPPPPAVPGPPSVIVGPAPFAHERAAPGASKTWMFVAALVVLGLLLGGGGGYALIQHQRAVQQERAEEAARQAELAAAEQRANAERAEAARLEAERVASAKAERERLEAEAAAKPPTAAERAAKAEQERRAAAEKAAAEKAAKEQERLAAASVARAAAEKAAADRAAAEKAAAAAKEKAAEGAAKAEGGCPEGMKSVATGAFKMGTPPNDQMMAFDEKPLTSVDVAGFCIDLFEYPNKRGTPPTAAVSWADAKRLCEGQGKRLCSEAEWEKACKGPGGARWPYGGAFDANTCNTEDDSGDPRALAPSGRFSKCRSGYGVADLAGNVAEWTEEKVVKGGSYASSDYAVRCSARKQGGSSKNTEVGFRCCATPH